MIKIEKTEVVGWEPAIRGMRNPKNSWNRIDTDFKPINCTDCVHEHDICNSETMSECPNIGPNDHGLMMNLAAGGPVHAKYRRMITVYVDITAPLYWWKEFDTYKVGTVANSCSTMHKIHDKEFTLDDFSIEHVYEDEKFVSSKTQDMCMPHHIFRMWLQTLNMARDAYLETGDKKYWWTMIQMLPSSYNQKRTIMLNYEVLAGIYPMRKGHKLDEWHVFCDWIESLPYSEIITGVSRDVDEGNSSGEKSKESED